MFGERGEEFSKGAKKRVNLHTPLDSGGVLLIIHPKD